MYVYLYFGFAVKSFVSLEGYEDSVSDSVVFKNNLCRVNFCDVSFDVINHLASFFLYNANL